MLWMAFRAGRAAARSGGRQPGAQTWGWPRLLIALAVIAAVVAHWPVASLSVIIGLVLVILPFAAIAAERNRQAASTRKGKDQ